MSTASHEPHSPARATTPPGLRYGTLAGFCLLNLVVLVYAISRALPHAPEREASAVVATAGAAAAVPGIAAGAGSAPSAAPAAETTQVTQTGRAAQAAPSPVAAQPAVPAVVNPIRLPDAAVVKGAYIQHCSACHGLDGRGEGPAAAQLYPRPRDFVDTPFRFAATSGQTEEIIAGLERAITQGVPRSAMPGFGGVLEESMIAGLARYVLSLRTVAAPVAGVEMVDVGLRPPTTPGLIARGAELYQSLGCVSCHGPSGRGDGEQSRKLVDSIGRPVRPSDLASGLFKSGQGPADLCRRILYGVPGTPMIAYEAVLARTNPDGTRDLTDAWALVAFIQSLRSGDQIIGHASGAELFTIPAGDEAMLLDPAHPAWLGVPATTIELRPLWERVETITHVDVRIVRTADRFAICADWRDGTMDLDSEHQVFSDAFAVMFAMGPDVPALPMGVHIEGFQAQAPVNLWHWKASRQYQAATGQRFDPQSALPRAAWAVFAPRGSEPFVRQRADGGGGAKAPGEGRRPEEPQDPGFAGGFPSFQTARMAGSVQQDARLEDRAVVESNAEGFGTLMLQPAERQDVEGSAVWSHGLWRVVLVRAIPSRDEQDVDLTQNRRIALSFAVWDGSKGDRDGIKLISGWHWLTVRPLEAAAGGAAAGAVPGRKGMP